MFLLLPPFETGGCLSAITPRGRTVSAAIVSCDKLRSRCSVDFGNGCCRFCCRDLRPKTALVTSAIAHAIKTKQPSPNRKPKIPITASLLAYPTTSAATAQSSSFPTPSPCPYSSDFSPTLELFVKGQRISPRQSRKNLYTIRLSNHRCSGSGHYSRYYRLVYPLLLLCFTQLRTAVRLVGK